MCLQCAKNYSNKDNSKLKRKIKALELKIDELEKKINQSDEKNEHRWVEHEKKKAEFNNNNNRTSQNEAVDLNHYINSNWLNDVLKYNDLDKPRAISEKSPVMPDDFTDAQQQTLRNEFIDLKNHFDSFTNVSKLEK